MAEFPAADAREGRRPRILAHRGLSLRCDENSLAAFRAAADVGVRWIETDVNTSADGVAYTIHDPDLRRVAGAPARIAEEPSSRLSQVRLRRGEPLPTLRQALADFPDLRFNIDLKDEGAVTAVPAVIEEAGAWDRVLIASFSESRRRRALASAPEGVPSSAGYGGIAVFRLISVCMPARACAAVWPRLSVLLRRWIAPFTAMQVPVEWKVGPVRIPVADRRFIRAAHACGLRVDVWTIDDPAEMRRLVELGADGLVTNRPDLATEAFGGAG